MDTPRILAIDDIRLPATQAVAEQVIAFYSGLIGLDRIEGSSDSGPVVFRGYPRSGPRLVIQLGEEIEVAKYRREVLIQVRCLTDFAEQLSERKMSFTWLHGWTFYDQRLVAFDPAGNRVELVSYHGLAT